MEISISLKNKMINKKNRKAGFYAIGIVLVTILVTGYALYSFNLVRNKYTADFRIPLEIVKFNSDIDNTLFYEKDKIILNAGQIYYNIARQGAVNIDNPDCSAVVHNSKQYVVFNEKCHPDTLQIKNLFIREIKANSNLKGYDFSMQENVLNANGEIIKKKFESSKSFISFSIEYNINPSFSIDLPREGMNLDDFSSLFEAASKCKESESLKQCLQNQGVLNAWDVNFNEDIYKFFRFNTKKYFFINEGDGMKFAPIEFNFALE